MGEESLHHAGNPLAIKIVYTASARENEEMMENLRNPSGKTEAIKNSKNGLQIFLHKPFFWVCMQQLKRILIDNLENSSVFSRMKM